MNQLSMSVLMGRSLRALRSVALTGTVAFVVWGGMAVVLKAPLLQYTGVDVFGAARSKRRWL